jgi:hypothetical protein
MKNFARILIVTVALAGTASTLTAPNTGDGSEPVPACWPGDTTCTPPPPLPPPTQSPSSTAQ